MSWIHVEGLHIGKEPTQKETVSTTGEILFPGVPTMAIHLARKDLGTDRRP